MTLSSMAISALLTDGYPEPGDWASTIGRGGWTVVAVIPALPAALVLAYRMEAGHMSQKLFTFPAWKAMRCVRIEHAP